MKKLLVVFLILAVIAGIVWYVLQTQSKPSQPKVVRNFEDCENAGNLVIDTVPRECHTKDDKIFVEIDNHKQYVGIIEPTAPVPYSEVESPFKVEGRAVGRWFYNQQLSGKLLDEKDNILATFYPKTSADTDTDELIPFVAAVHFRNPLTKKGKIVIEKTNVNYTEGKLGPLVVSVEFKDKSE